MNASTLKTNIRFYLGTMYKSIGIYYVIIIIIHTFFALSFASGYSNSLSGISAIFLFVCGLNSFKENFYYYLSMCRTRKELFTGFVFMAAIVAVVMATADSLLSLLFNSIAGRNIFNLGIMAGGTGITLRLYFHVILAYFAFFSLGYMVTIAYYRMNKSLKWLVSVGVPVTLFILLPAVDAVYLNNALADALARLMRHTFLSASALASMASTLAAGVAFLGFSYLGVRNAVIKKS